MAQVAQARALLLLALNWYLSLLWGLRLLGLEVSILLLKAIDGGLLRDSREGLLRR